MSLELPPQFSAFGVETRLTEIKGSIVVTNQIQWRKTSICKDARQIAAALQWIAVVMFPCISCMSWMGMIFKNIMLFTTLHMGYKLKRYQQCVVGVVVFLVLWSVYLGSGYKVTHFKLLASVVTWQSCLNSLLTSIWAFI